MIVYELIVNSARHAFSGGEGEIRVELLCAGAVVKCSVTDNGSAAATAVPGRGLKIIDELSKNLGGRFVRKFGSLGSCSILTIPYNSAPAVIAERERSKVQFPEYAVQVRNDIPSTAPWRS